MSVFTVVCLVCGYSSEGESQDDLTDDEMNAGEPPACPVCGSCDWDFE